MKVQNKNNIGNPYHDEDGKFTSENSIGWSGENQPSSINKIKKMIFGESDIQSNTNSQNENLDDLDSFFENLNNQNDDSNDLDNLFQDLIEEDKKDDNLKKDKQIKENIVTNLTDADYADVFLEISDELDINKLADLSIEEQKEIINAFHLILNKNSDNDYLKLDKLNQQKFYNLWINSVSPSDYEEKKDKIIAKKNYFLFDYKGNDKDEKLFQLQEFEKVGKEYLKEKNKLDSKYKYAEELVEKYQNPNYQYSKKRKDDAIWIKNGMAGSKKEFSIVQDKVFEDLNKENPKYEKSVLWYTESYSFINEPLRGIFYGNHDFEKKKKFVETVENITHAISKSSYDKDIWLQRGTNKITLNNEFMKEITWNSSMADLQKLVGKQFVDNAFVSCGAAKDTGFTGKDIIMNIFCPKGTNMLYLPGHSHYSSENEMLLQRGYSYKITKVEKKDGKIYLDCDCILGSDKNKYDTNKLKEIQNEYFYD